jgi:hypothetical protein
MRHKPAESYFEGDINNLCTDEENEEVEEFDVIDGNDKAKFYRAPALQFCTYGNARSTREY